MYFGATTSTFQKARQLRNRMTPEEIVLWEKFKKKQICGVRFRRQHPINTFIADFYCHKARLVVEIDGRIHLESKEEDKERTKTINDFGVQVIRFNNEEIHTNIDIVVSRIRMKVKKRLDYPAEN